MELNETSKVETSRLHERSASHCKTPPPKLPSGRQKTAAASSQGHEQLAKIPDSAGVTPSQRLQSESKAPTVDTSKEKPDTSEGAKVDPL